MELTVKIQRRTKYGKDLIFPVNILAKLLVRLTGRKTFFPKDLEVIERVGFEIEEIPRSLSIEDEPDPTP